MTLCVGTDVQQWPRVKGKWMRYDEINQHGDRQLMRTENSVDYHGGWNSLVCGKGLIGILEQLSGQVSDISFYAVLWLANDLSHAGDASLQR